MQNFDQIWFCTTCHLCQDRCPRGIPLTDEIVKARAELIETGNIPPDVRDMLLSIQKHRNPFGISKFKRDNWAKDLNVPNVKTNPNFEYLFYVGCANSFDTRNKQIAAKTVQIFNEIGLNYAVLGKEEGCCGNDVRRAGEEGLFELLMEENIKIFEKYGVEKIVTHSPHCYNTFKNEYNGYEVKLVLEFIHDAIKKGKLNLKPLNIKVTYHDSCFLGRYNGIYDLPREVLKSIPGVELVEMKNNRKLSICCGGGAGNIIGEYPGEIKPARIRAREAAETGAEVLAVACPFCLLMLEDAVKAEGLDDKIVVKDIVELVYESAYE